VVVAEAAAKTERRTTMQTIEDIKAMKIEIFDPPMCCPTGLCGPNIDPALLDVNEAILKLQKEYDSKLKIERYLLSQQGPKFMQNKDVLELLKKYGVEVLPVTVVNGKVVKQKSYPTYDEMKSYADVEQ
jgi:hypothetical protein